MSYITDLTNAKVTEHIFANLLTSGGWSTSVTPTNQGQIFYDVSATSSSLSLTFEIKDDKLSSTTGNAAIEVSRGATPTGLFETTANYWAHCIGGIYYCFEVDKLKQLIQSKPFRKVKGGDGWKTSMVLVPVEDIKQNADFRIGINNDLSTFTDYINPN